MMHISEGDLEPLLRQRILLKTYHRDPWLTIDQIYVCYKGMLNEDIYLPCHDPVSRESMATYLLRWSKRKDSWLLKQKRGRHCYYRVNEVMDDGTGCYVSLLYHRAKVFLGWERNHNFMA